MFSYRHAFHAGNHGDVLKHTALIATLRYLLQKDVALTVIDTHAGAGLYRLDGDFARTSAEAQHGIAQLLSQPSNTLAPALTDYIATVRHFNTPNTEDAGNVRIYPGSPLIAHSLLRAHDRLELFELHPTDTRTLRGHLAQLHGGAKVRLHTADGFTGVRPLVPPASRRALVLCDPSYELKSDYAQVIETIEICLQRFPTGVYAIWLPIVARQQAHELPRKLQKAAERAGRSWLHAALSVRGGHTDAQGRGAGLTGSAMFFINPPYTLAQQLQPALDQLVQHLGEDRHARAWLQTSPHS